MKCKVIAIEGDKAILDLFPHVEGYSKTLAVKRKRAVKEGSSVEVQLKLWKSGLISSGKITSVLCP